jgi:2-phosphoglycerate kinase
MRGPAAGLAAHQLKTFVVDSSENTKMPFLRGILTRSLLDAGVSFDEAFEVATAIRDELSECAEVSTDELRDHVGRILSERGDELELELYQSPAGAPSKILVNSLSGSASAFSRGRHQRYLQSSGLGVKVSEQITAMIFEQLLAVGVTSLTTRQLGYMTWLCLGQEVGRKAAKQYLVWSEFQRSERPLLLMIGGAVGCGKSSIATELAHRFEIVRTQSTDLLREVMRMMIPKRLLPVLHTSSFDAWKTLPIQDKKGRDKDLLVAEGFRSQVELLSVPCEAVLQRAVRESVPLILEGVHVHPELLDRAPSGSDAIMLHVTLVVLRPRELKARLRGRGSEAPKRRAKRYLNKFDSIWRLQSFLLSEADRLNTPIIQNNDKEKAIFQIIATVNDALKKHFSGDPAEVFGSIVTEKEQQIQDLSWQEALPLLAR